MQIRLGCEQGHCKVEQNGQDDEAEKYIKEFSEKSKLQNSAVFGNVIGGDGHPPNVDISLGRQFLVKDQHQPQRCLKVLLVEDDDSTRKVVRALLCHCRYEVTAVANGLQAWDLLEDTRNQFDLVLTEAMGPCLSGIDLLSKIMSHRTYKHIPVIMMSSHDSMILIFKCLTMGAVDFLIKPLRKNELKNIWKHIWKRHQNSSANCSGSISNSQTQKVVRLQNATDPENNDDSKEESNNTVHARQAQKAVRLQGVTGAANSTGSNEKNDNAGSDSKIVDGSDKGIGTQAGDKDSQPRSAYELDRHLNMTSSAHIIKAKKEQCQNECMQLFGISRDCQDKTVSDCAMGQKLEIAIPIETAPDLQEEKIFYQACARKEDIRSSNSEGGGQIGDTLARACECVEPLQEAIDLIGSIARKPIEANEKVEDYQRAELEDKEGNGLQVNDETICDSNFTPLLELTLRGSHPISDGDGVHEPHVLRHSGASAFSRYNTKCNHIPQPSGDTFPLNKHSFLPHFVMPFERMNSANGSGIDVSLHASKHPETSHNSGNQQDMDSAVGSSGQDMAVSLASSHMEIPTPIPILYNGVPVQYGAAFPAMFHPQTCALSRSSGTEHMTERPERQEVYDFACHHKQLIMPPQTLQPSYQNSNHHYYHIQHPEPHEDKQSHQHLEKGEHSMNTLTMMTVPNCGLSSMVTFDGNHGEIGCNGTGSVNKASSMDDSENNGKNDHYNHLHHNGMHHHLSHEDRLSKQDKQIIKNSGLTPLLCGSCLIGQSVSSNGYESVNASEHGSNNRINGQAGHSSGQSSGDIVTGMNGESGTVNGVMRSTGTSGGGVDQNHSARREAALKKFRLKRKERCFEKKVRYQSRKRLAEQRPRVRGQFVCQAVCKSIATCEVD